MKLKRIYNRADVDAYRATLAARQAEFGAAINQAIPNLPVAAIEAASKILAASTGESGLSPAYVSLGDTGTSPEQNFSVGLVTAGLNDGWMELSDDTLILRVHPEALIYKVKRAPGRYCLHCGEKLGDDVGGDLARLHIAQKHRGVASPDPHNPAGYIMLNYFECVLDSAQHEKHKARKGIKPQYPVREA